MKEHSSSSSSAKHHMPQHLFASACAAVINYPLWRASAMGQSGFRVTNSTASSFVSSSMIHPSLLPYAHAFCPPYKGMVAVICGMTWARAAIFWGSEMGKETLQKYYTQGYPNNVLYTLTPPLIVSTLVQCVNQPIVRASVTLQNPQSHLENTRSAIKEIYNSHGLRGLWHGTSAGILKTVPKYCTAILVKDYMEHHVLPHPDPQSDTYKTDKLIRSAVKSGAAGLAGAALTNPLDVIRNEMFKTNRGLLDTVRGLKKEYGTDWKWMCRGLGKNLVAVSVPVASTIFFTDMFIQLSSERNSGM